ncbi:SusC/RagA family TonB-linked outer membrane protein [Leeuwenhoekiella marinoflava]|uniref:TonB-linked SusC/RagA family outer membrane protein n=2 Tax=Leeuwenhoekiella marinoflava TaxID=988 RepID=A0A4Q0PNB5_9FLAO|nr:SusC/RagA family TonB-linked outer membrane protein [Leeuwenhoekiella marinoflava]RXG29857.1 TonB-linked SusC/RagA family outer membrane protein [Leeuwenhoekiella marinoflava]SHF28140.1 TonB-linked outer membrane protein, SusC/RagA family [Leeuwenhoekiella marinoflava DSM 3653]
MNKLLNLFVLLLAFAGFAQQEVSGTVKDPNNVPLGGVTVMIPNTSRGTVTDFDGNFTIEATKGEILQFSYVGFTKQNITVSNQTNLEVIMAEDAQALDAVVVTALGIKKEVKALGYAVQEVAGENLEKAKEPNFINQLSGRVAGLNIKNSTDLFQNPAIQLRGATPLLVIDGIPDRTLDIWKVNSDDIESLSVLKGATASALYGSVGRNGAIMITTKRGKKGKLSVTFNNSTQFQTDFIRVPDVQTTYGNGNRGVYAYVDGSGSGTEGGGWIWGPRLDQADPTTPSGFFETTQYNSPIDPDTGELIPIAYTSRGKDNIKNFFDTGIIQSNNVSVGWGNDKADVRMSLSNNYQKGIVPNTDLKNTSFNLAGTIRPSDKLTINGTLTYNKQFTSNFPEVGYGPTNYLYNLILWTGTDVDVRDLKNYWREGQEGIQQRHFNISYYNNPYFQAYEYKRGYNKTNVYGNASFNYEVTDELSLRGRTGINEYSLYRDYKEPKSYIGYGAKSRGNFSIAQTNYFDITSDLALHFEKKITDNFGITAEGAYVNYYRNSKNTTQATDGLNLPGFYNLANNAGATLLGTNREEKETINSFYGFVDLEFYNAFYLSLTGRNDKVSTLPDGNNSFFYPSASASVVLSSLFDMPDWVSFAKLRGSWSRVSEGKIKVPNDKIDNDPYNHILAYEKGTTWDGTPATYFGDNLLAANLEPETSDTWEVGANFRVLNNRLGFDLAYYQARDYNKLIYSPISDASGYSSILLNGNEFERKGVELTLDATPIKTNNFSWNTQVNLSHYRRYQKAIYGDREQTEGFLRVGDRTDKIYTGIYQTNADGAVIFENGLPVNDPYDRFIGYDEPDLTYGISNQLKYKNITLSFLFDGRLGGLMYSTTNQKMWWGGTSKGTVNQFRDDANNGENTYIGEGVVVTGGTVSYDVNGAIVEDTRTYAPNDVPVNYISFMQTTSNNQNSNYHYYKETFIKLRELTLTYQFTDNVLKHTPFKALDVSLVGRNLGLASKIPNVDPDSGVDNLHAPSTRNIGFNINAKF